MPLPLSEAPGREWRRAGQDQTGPVESHTAALADFATINRLQTAPHAPMGAGGGGAGGGQGVQVNLWGGEDSVAHGKKRGTKRSGPQAVLQAGNTKVCSAAHRPRDRLARIASPRPRDRLAGTRSPRPHAVSPPPLPTRRRFFQCGKAQCHPTGLLLPHPPVR